MKSHYLAELIDWVTGWPWQVFATLTFRYPAISGEQAQKMLREWCRENAKRDGVRVACKGVLNFTTGHPHIHLLMLAHSGKTGKTLADVNLKQWERGWPARAEISNYTGKRAYYTFVKNRTRRHFEMAYGENLLKDIMKKSVAASRAA